MPTFTYKAVDTHGKQNEGTLVAETQQAAMKLLTDRALFPVEISEGGEARRGSFIGGARKVKLRLVAAFYGQLADLLKAGVPMLRALDVLARQSSSAIMGEVVREVREDVAGGMSLADALTKHPRAFHELHIAMVRAGERGGFLEDVLARIAGFIERQDELRNKLMGSMIYPALLVFVGGGLIIVLMTIIVPKLRPFIERAKPNVLTVVVFSVSDVLQNYGIVLLMIVSIISIAAVAYFRTAIGRRRFDLLKLRTPVLGKTLVMISLCRFCRILGTMLASGVPILQALKISRDSTGNEVLAEEVDKASENVQKGGQMSEPFGQCPLFPLDIVDMIAVAEESNNLEGVLVQIADTNEARTARMIDLGVRLVEPLLLTAIAGVVAVVAVALLVPILTMSAAAQG